LSSTSAMTDFLPKTGLWSIEPLHSSVSFSLRHHGVATFRSGFTNISGTYDAAQRQLVGKVQASDVTLSGLDKLKAHFLTSDFMNAEEFPTLSFRSTSIENDGHQLKLEGELTFRGITKPISATGSFGGPQTLQHKRDGSGTTSERLGIDLTSTIDRREWGMTFNTEMVPGVLNLGWKVKLEAALELIKNVEH